MAAFKCEICGDDLVIRDGIDLKNSTVILGKPYEGPCLWFGNACPTCRQRILKFIETIKEERKK